MCFPAAIIGTPCAVQYVLPRGKDSLLRCYQARFMMELRHTTTPLNIDSFAWDFLGDRFPPATGPETLGLSICTVHNYLMYCIYSMGVRV